MNDSEFPITIYHNPACTSSRKVLALIRTAGYDPYVVEYLKVGWSKSLISSLITSMNVTAPALMRERGTPAAELGLLRPGVSEQAIISAMIEHPILVNRPIVATPLGIKLCRPPETVLTLLHGQAETSAP